MGPLNLGSMLGALEFVLREGFLSQRDSSYQAGNGVLALGNIRRHLRETLEAPVDLWPGLFSPIL